MIEACALCGADRFAEGPVVYDRQVARRDDYRLLRCRQCGLLSLSAPPAEPARVYPADYAPHAAPEPRAGPPSWRERRRLEAPRGGGRLLDVGCGGGALLLRYRALGWEVRGVEPAPGAVLACRARDLEVEEASLEDARLPERYFDLVLLHHVIEHVRRPLDALARAKAALAPGGELVVVTPNAGGLGYRLYGSCWHGVDAPRHLHLYDPHTLSALAARAGLRVVRLGSVASARFLATSRHNLHSQGPVLPPGLAARAAAIERSRESVPGIARFRRVIRPVAWVAARLGFGEILRARLAVGGASS